MNSEPVFRQIPESEDVLFINVKTPHPQPITGTAKDYFSQSFQHANEGVESNG